VTLFRLAAIPVVMILVSHEVYGWGAFLFTVAALTDYIDGWLARRWEQTTVLGAFLDLTADKVLVMATLAALLTVDRVNLWLAVIIIAREIAIMALRGLAGADGKMLPPSKFGKWKATLQFVAIGFAIVRLDDPWGAFFLDEWLMIAATIITVVTGVDYVRRLRVATTSDA
jgi:CDP-diacylglycerol--glycerol-3-phosphate 3-phosphatidyltransferase